MAENGFWSGLFEGIGEVAVDIGSEVLPDLIQDWLGIGEDVSPGVGVERGLGFPGGEGVGVQLLGVGPHTPPTGVMMNGAAAGLGGRYQRIIGGYSRGRYIAPGGRCPVIDTHTGRRGVMVMRRPHPGGAQFRACPRMNPLNPHALRKAGRRVMAAGCAVQRIDALASFLRKRGARRSKGKFGCRRGCRRK